jgi:hypothetical protein
MTRSKIIGLRFPVGGINRRQGFQSQPPFTTVDCLNVRPDSVYGHRERGGSRPGTNPSHRGTLGSGNPVRMLANLDVIETTGLTYWQDTFDGDSMGSVWSKPSWITRLPEVESGVAYGSKRYSTSGAVRAAFATTIDTAKDYIVEMFIAPRGSVINGTYRLYLRMDNTTPDASSAGVTATLTIAKDGTFGGSLSVAGGSTYAFTAGDHGGVAAGWFSCRISGNNVSAYWRNSTLISSQAVGSHSGQRVGFSLATSDRVEPAIESFRVQYYLSGGNQRTNRRIVLASSNGSLYKEDFLGSTVAVSSSLTLASDRTIQAQQRLQKLYIADCGEWKSSGTDGARGTGNGKFDATGVTDWTTVGIDTDDDVLVIYDS